MTMRMKFVWNLCKFIKKKTKEKISHVHKYSQPLLNTLLKQLWQQLQPRVWCYKLGTSIFGMVSPIHLWKTAQAPSGWMVSISASVFRSLQSCSVGLKSGLCLGHSRTFTELSHSHSFVILAVCLELLSCWKVNLLHSLRFWIIIFNAISINSLIILSQYFGALSISFTLMSPCWWKTAP